jgi:hypothetical protein
MAPRRSPKAPPGQAYLPGMAPALPGPPPPSGLPGSLSCAAVVAGLVSYSLDEARHNRGMSRAAVAARMTELTGEHISEAMLNAMTADSKEGHRFPAQWQPALVVATGCVGLPAELDYRIGAKLLIGAEVLEAQIAAEDKAIEDAKRRKAMLLRSRGGGHV